MGCSCSTRTCGVVPVPVTDNIDNTIGNPTRSAVLFHVESDQPDIIGVVPCNTTASETHGTVRHPSGDRPNVSVVIEEESPSIRDELLRGGSDIGSPTTGGVHCSPSWAGSESVTCNPEETCPDFCSKTPYKNPGFIITDTMNSTPGSDEWIFTSGTNSHPPPAMDPPPDTVTSAVTYRDNDGNKVLNQRYLMVNTVGKGSFAKVKVAHDVQTNQTVAVKIMRKSMLQHQYIQNRKSRMGRRNSDEIMEMESTFTLIRQEIEIMSKFRHPSLVRLFSVIDDVNSDKLYLVTEFMGGGPLRCDHALCQEFKTEHIMYGHTAHEHHRTNVPQVRSRFVDLLHGLQHLHDNDVIHMDIKPENILMDMNGNCKLADFGACMVHSVSSGDLLRGVQGTPAFFAPEMLSQSMFHGEATDVWALGVCLYVHVYGKGPFVGSKLPDIQQSIISTPLHCPAVTVSGVAVPELLLDVLYRMLCKDPKFRITVRELIGHPFFTEKVPLAWYIRVWKERRLERCTDVKAAEATIQRVHLQDEFNTDRTKCYIRRVSLTDHTVTVDDLHNTPLYQNLSHGTAQGSLVHETFRSII
eukprot:PhF_6_TR36336/c2_g1_i3/m.53235/K07359/CAMKK2; calcium/calmodulin-dependent protein kinase kinase 2